MMKLIDENGAVVETPDMTLGWVKDDMETVEHPAQEAVPEQSHYETAAEYPNGGKDVRKVIDREAEPAREAWTEQVPVQRYIRYTAEELAAQKAQAEAARKRQEALDTLPAMLAALQSAQSDTDAMAVEHEYRMAMLELGLSETT